MIRPASVRRYPQFCPLGDDIVYSPAGVFTEANTAEGNGDIGIADFIRSRSEKVAGGEGIARVPEYGAISEVANFWLTGVVLVVLKTENIQRIHGRTCECRYMSISEDPERMASRQRTMIQSAIILLTPC